MNAERQLLKGLLQKLNEYNAQDMLDGYLNDLGTEFNVQLEELQLPTIEQVGESEEIGDFSLLLHHLTSDELRGVGTSTGITSIHEALKLLGESAKSLRVAFNEPDYRHFRFYEGDVDNATSVQSLPPMRLVLKHDLQKHL